MTAYANEAAYQAQITNLVDTIKTGTDPHLVRVARDRLCELEAKVREATGWSAASQVTA